MAQSRRGATAAATPGILVKPYTHYARYLSNFTMFFSCNNFSGLLQRHRLHRRLPAGLHQQPGCHAGSVPLQLDLHVLLRLHQCQQQEEEGEGTATGKGGQIIAMSAAKSACISQLSHTTYPRGAGPCDDLPVNPPWRGFLKLEFLISDSHGTVQSSNPCDNSRIKLQVSMLVTPKWSATAGGLDNIISATKGAMFSAYGNDRLCSGQFQKSTVVRVNKVMVGATRRCEEGRALIGLAYLCEKRAGPTRATTKRPPGINGVGDLSVRPFGHSPAGSWRPLFLRHSAPASPASSQYLLLG